MEVDENGNPIQPAVEQPAAPDASAAPAIPVLPPAVEQRIAEITRMHAEERRALEARIDEQGRQYADTIRLFAERPAPPAPDPYALRPDEEPLDPAIERQMRRLMGPQIAQLQATIERQNAHLQNLSFRQFEGQEPPEVISLAKQYMETWRREGKTGWVEADAVDFAWAKLNRQDKQARANEAGNRFGRPAQAQQHRPQTEVVQFNGVPPVSTPQSNRSRVPTNIDSLSLDQRLAAYAAAGIGDEPL